MTSGLGFEPKSLQESLRDNTEHVCTPEDCPPVGGYYVSCTEAGQVWLMAGPYRSHGEALANERKATLIASNIDGRAWFMSWGTCRVRDGELKPGKLNQIGKM